MIEFTASEAEILKDMADCWLYAGYIVGHESPALGSVLAKLGVQVEDNPVYRKKIQAALSMARAGAFNT